MATGPSQCARARGCRCSRWPRSPARAALRGQQELRGALPNPRRGCRRGRGIPGQRPGEGREEAKWSRPASSGAAAASGLSSWGTEEQRRPPAPSPPGPSPPALGPRSPPLAQSLRSGASLLGERPGEAPGSCSGSLNLPRPELRRRGRAGKRGGTRVSPPLPGPGRRLREGPDTAPGPGDVRASGGPAPAGPARCCPFRWREGDGTRPRSPGNEGLEVREMPLSCPGGWTRL